MNSQNRVNPNPAIDLQKVITGEVRLSYVHLVEPRDTQDGNKKYSVTMLIPMSDVMTKQRIDAAIAASIEEAISSKWNGAKPVQPPVPIYDGNGLRPSGERFGDECKNCWVLTASSEQKPQVVDANLQPIIDSTELYSGMYGRVSIRFFGYNSTGKKGIGCGLNNVQKLRDGEPLAGRADAATDFGNGTGVGYIPQQPAYAPPGYPSQNPPPTAQPQPYPQPAPYAGGYAPQQPEIDPITGQPKIMGLPY